MVEMNICDVDTLPVRLSLFVQWVGLLLHCWVSIVTTHHLYLR
jgi:hypothetical protein